MIQIGSETENQKRKLVLAKRELVLAKTNISGFEVTIHSKGYVAYLKTKLRIRYSKREDGIGMDLEGYEVNCSGYRYRTYCRKAVAKTKTNILGVNKPSFIVLFIL